MWGRKDTGNIMGKAIGEAVKGAGKLIAPVQVENTEETETWEPDAGQSAMTLTDEETTILRGIQKWYIANRYDETANISVDKQYRKSIDRLIEAGFLVPDGKDDVRPSASAIADIDSIGTII
jgi:hypothetical protein